MTTTLCAITQQFEYHSHQIMCISCLGLPCLIACCCKPWSCRAPLTQDLSITQVLLSDSEKLLLLCSNDHQGLSTCRMIGLHTYSSTYHSACMLHIAADLPVFIVSRSASVTRTTHKTHMQLASCQHFKPMGALPLQQLTTVDIMPARNECHQVKYIKETCCCFKC